MGSDKCKTAQKTIERSNKDQIFSGKKYPKYSVLMTVYKNEKPELFEKAINSMLDQTVTPSEFVLVVDGPLTEELYNIVDRFRKNKIFKIIELKENCGSGPASATGVLNCSNEWIARLDSDDFSMPERIEKQFLCLNDNPNLDVIGSNILEVEIENQNNQQKVILPEKNDEIRKFTGRRCPFRTSAIMFKKEVVLKAGNYREFYRVEDYDMFARLVASGAECMNVQEFLSYMNIDKDYYRRRGGIKIAKSIVKLKKEIRRLGLATISDQLISVPAQVCVSLMPNGMRDMFYRKALRK